MNFCNKKQLHKAGRSIELPFCLSPEGSDDILHCQRLLRIVPGRRAVLLGKWGKREVVAKLFYWPLRINRHLKREEAGIRALLNAGIATADILYAGNARDTGVGVLLLKYIQTAGSFRDVWNAIDSQGEKHDLLRRFMQILAKMHQAGLKQRDLHLDNFLIKGHEIYSMDGSNIKRNKAGHPLKVAESLNNLALLFSLSIFRDRSMVRGLYTDYANVRGWEDTDDIFDDLQLRIERWRSRGMKRYLRKIFRESTEFICNKSLTRFMVCKRAYYTPAIAAFLDDPDRVLNDLENPLLKRGGSSTVGRIKIDDHDLVVKRYNIKGFWHGLRRCFMATRAAHSWRNAHQLFNLGIATPMPIAFLEKRFGPFRGTAYFINEYVEGPRAVDFFKGSDLHQKLAIAREIAEIFEKLRLARISHGDMKATNIIIHQQPVLVDLDAMHVHINRRRFDAAHRKDIRRFFKNWIGSPEVDALFRDLI
jgi:tRNA A-37 threonylcarbamoyl transferase component Bud32